MWKHVYIKQKLKKGMLKQIRKYAFGVILDVHKDSWAENVYEGMVII
jgi:hypothetical protein